MHGVKIDPDKGGLLWASQQGNWDAGARKTRIPPEIRRGARARDMFRMYRFKDHFEYRKKNPMIEVAPGIMRNEAVSVSGTWDDSRMYSPYPYEDSILNPNL